MCALSISTTSALQLLLLVRRMFPPLLHRFIYPVVGRLCSGLFLLVLVIRGAPHFGRGTHGHTRDWNVSKQLGSACELIWPSGQMLGC